MKGRVNTGGGGGLNASVILVAAPTGSTVTCTKGGTTKTAVEKNGLWTFRGIENGEWTVKATKGGQSTSQPVNVTQFDVYRVTLAYFNATIETTFPTDCTSVTCKKGATTLSVPSGSLSSGSYNFNIPEIGEWVLYCTNGTDSDTKTIDVTEETAYSVTLSFALRLFFPGVGIADGYSLNSWTVASTDEDSISFTNNNVRANIRPAIDLTPYKTCSVTYSFKMNSTGNGPGRIGFQKSDNYMNYDAYNNNFPASFRMSAGASGAKSSIDISKLNGEYFFAIHTFDNISFEITEVVLSK